MIREQEAARAEPAVVDIYPLSPMQQGMLFHTLYAPGSAVYFEQFACTLEGDLDDDAFERAWRRAADRHPILRTAFLWEGVQEPHQVVFDRVELPIERLDWLGLDPDEQHRRLAAYLEADRARGFDLLAPPLMRLTLVRTGERAWRFVWRFHHLLLDGWSGNLLLGEVFHLYECFRKGQEPRLPPAPPFRDYIAWLGRQDLARAEAFWRRALAGFTSPTPLVVDRPAASVRELSGEAYERRHTRFPEGEAEALQRLARGSRLTLNTLFEGAWALLLARYSREPEVVFGATSSGRPVELPGVEAMAGLFVNTLPARVAVPLSAPLLPWLQGLQDQQAEMREYEFSPLAQVQAWSDVPPGTPLFESIQGLENYPVSRWSGRRLEGLALRDLEAWERTNYPLTVLASPGPPMSLEIWFERRRFDAAAIDRMLGHLRTLLTEFLGRGDRPLADLPLLTSEERAQLLADGDARPSPVGLGVAELFAAQVARTPGAVALLGEGQALTYREVDALANRFALRLRSLGVGPEELVGVSAASPLRTVVAILGILKAGAAYLPLDPAYPRERLAWILEAAGARVLVADPGLLPLSEEDGEGLVRLDATAPLGESEADPPAATGGGHLAYAIFTSGSTGRPKGILVSHEALLQLAASFIAALDLGPGERLLMVPSLSFDASVGDLFPALLSGAALVVHPAPSELSAEGLLALCEEQGVTVLDIPAAFWNAWAEELAAAPRRGLLPDLRLVIAGGESIAPERVERWAAATGRRVVFFGPYGPTEATVCTTAYKTIDARELPRGAVRLPIGRPLPHARVRLLDHGLGLVPVLVPGEVAIGGAGLARGYLGRPDLTAERFVPDPWATEPGERLYRTGDLARLLPDGNLEFAGRVDQQVKVRGYRIELGEIEAALLRHPGVREAVVAAREDAPGDRRLVAYVVPEPLGSSAEDEASEPVAEWQRLFEESYAEGIEGRGETLAAALDNFAGWNRSDTGEPIPLEEMREWADRTAERILSLRPQRVLEIGCGTGLLLLRVAPSCRSYVGTDFSAGALGYLARVLDRAGIPGAELRQQRADDWSGVAPESVDVVVLNSVVQYFPGVDYLRRVLRGAVAAVRPGGAVFLGDLRSLPLLAAFHAWAEAAQAPEGLPQAELDRRVARRIALERELAVDPALFAALARELPRIGRVEVQLKRGRSRNELTRFRYDVTLHVGPPPAVPVPDPVDWTAAGLDLAEVRRRLEAGPEALRLAGIPDPRVGSAGEGVEPEDLWELAARLGYELDAATSEAAPDRYDALFHRAGGPFLPAPGATASPRPWSEYGNEPARADAARRLVPALRELLKASLPDYMVPSAFVVLDALPVTPNGKVDRRALPAPDRERRDDGSGFVAPRTPAEETLAAIWAEVLGLERVGVTDNFFELGGDSILSIQIVSRAGQAGLPLTPKQIFEHQTIGALAAAGAGPAVAAEQGPVEGEAPLTPIQRWFFEAPGPEPHHWNQALLFELHEPFAPPVLERALGLLLEHHDALRLRFVQEGEGVRQLHAAPGGPTPFCRIDLAALPEEVQKAEITAAASALQGSLDLERGPLVRLALLDLGPGLPARLLTVVHHLAVDGVSWRILLEDLISACRDLPLPAKTTSFRQWAERLAARAAGPELAGELGYWLDEARERALRLPLDAVSREAGDNREGSARTVTALLPVEETRALLREAAARSRIQDLLTTALARALSRWTGRGPLVVDLEGHGRDTLSEGVDVSRTVGWLTISYPALLEVPEGTPLECLRAVEEQLRRIPGNGSGYGLLRHLGPAEVADRLAALPPAEVNFNYLGQLDQVLPEGSPLRAAAEPAGATRSPHGERRHLLEVNAFVAGGRLRVDWSYSARLHRRETVERLAAGFTAALRELIAAGSEVEDVYPLSPMQEGMLFHTLYSPGSGVYVQQLACTLRGGLDPRALREAWERTFRRHAALRTEFLVRAEGRPLQAVRRRIDLPWEELDWRDLPAPERRHRLADLARADRERGFDPSVAPLSRLWLVQAAADEHRLLWSHHHLLMDGWCLPLVLRDVLAGYEALRQGREPSFPPVRPYRDYIAWIERQDRKAAERFFRGMLAGLEAPTPLGIDRPAAPGAGPGPSEAHRGHLTAEESERLRTFARRHRLTLNTLVQGAWALLLARYGGTDDVVFGATVSGRPAELPGVEEMVGLFVNTLPVRVRVDLERLLAPWLQELQATNLELRRHEATPLVDVQSWSGLPGGTPLFESLLAFENYPVDPSLTGSGGSLALEAIETFERTNYPLELLIVPSRVLALAVTCDRDRVAGAAAARLVEHLLALLAAFAAGPERRLGEFSPLSPAERHQILIEWNDSAAAPLEESSLARLFEERSAATPRATAVVFGGERLAYGELNAWANRVAHRLRGLGVGPGVRVGISVERSPELIAGFLAVLKAGGTYVPIDPAYPAERRAFLLADCRAQVLLIRDGGSGTGTAAVLDLDDVPRRGEDPGNPPALSGPESLVYIIYTSGSTGRPKGAGVYQSAFLRLVSWYVAELALGTEDHVLVLSSASFDLTQKNYYAPLVCGGELHLAPPLYDPAELVSIIEREGITRINCTPSAFYPLLEQEGTFPRLASLRSVVLGGEPIVLERLRAWRASGWCRAEVVNSYGPTECTDVVSFDRLEEDGGAPIGRPLPDVRLWILGPDLAPLPAGIAGEIFVGGAAVGAGYLGDPALTAAKFLPDPHGGEPGARLYRTGDLARALPDGLLEYLGRIDQQVKIHGFRIEPGEIEAALLRHPGVREAAVVAREDAPGDVRLVAYCAPRGEGWGTDPELRRWLAERLPEPLLPATFVRLDALPLTPSGKLDRRALPAPARPEEAVPASSRGLVEPLVAQIWAEVLGARGFGPHDSFFDLGGQSLLAMRVVARLRAALGVEIELRDLFATPTVAGLAQAVERALHRTAAPEAPPLVPTPRDGDLPLSFAQQRLWFLAQLDPRSVAYNLPTAVRLPEEVEPAALAWALREVVRRHEALRTRFENREGAPIQVIDPPSPAPLPLVDLAGLPARERGRELERLAVHEAARPFDLEAGPVLRVTLLQLARVEHVLLATMHHIASDAWSMEILHAELAASYRAALCGRTPALPELPVQYADFARWQRGWLQGEVLAHQIAYWRERLAGAPAVLELPTDRPRQAVQGDRGAGRHLALSAESSDRVRRLGRQQGATLFMTLLAGFTALLSRAAGQDDLNVGTPVAGRTRLETEGLIGFFVNTLVLRCDLGGDPTFGDLLARIRRVALEAHAHQDLPFEKLVEELQPDRALDHTPLFQAMLVFEEARATDLEDLGGSERPAKFDLTLVIGERAGRLGGELSYRTELFDGTTIGRTAGHLERLLAAAAADPGLRLSQLPLLAPEERHQLLREWNDTPGETGWTGSLQRILEDRAAAVPEAPAVVGSGEILTYSRLHARANRVARRLRELGVGPGGRVALWLERSPDLVVAILATLKAGGAYVPLDPSYPAERLAFVLEDCGAGVVLSHGGLAGRLPGGGRAPVILVDREEDLPGDDSPLLPIAGPEDPLYVIYTSGSTGRPKGAGVHQGGFLNLVRWYASEFRFDADDRFLVFVSAGFDQTQKNFFAPLACGALLVLADPGPYDPREIVDAVERHRITRLNCAPGAFYPLLEEERFEALSSLRTVFLGGEPIAAARLEPWLRSAGGRAEVVNTYGPTECTDTVSFHRLPPPGTAGSGAVPIGRPLPGLRLVVLDQHLSPVPVGVAGHLAIGGVGVGIGYLGRAALTAERFVPDPFAEEPGARLYWTGDLARLRPDGEIDFLGRIDHQVKLRGFRIELGEIEAALADCPGVREAAVLLREDIPGELRLVAYCVPQGEGWGTVPDLRRRLAARLPEPMIPSLVVELPALPLTAHGKVDRRALPAPEERRNAVLTPSRTLLESAISEIWAEVLGLREPGVHTSFFELGGHSLLATQVVSRLRASLGVEVALRDLFEAPTIAGLARTVERELQGGAVVAEPPLVPTPREGDLPLSFSQQRLWFLDQLAPGSAAYNIPAAVRLEGALAVPLLARALAEVVRRHEVLRTRLETREGSPVQRIDPPGPPGLPLVDLAALPAAARQDEAGRLATEEAARAFDLARGPLLRLALLQFAEGEHVLLATMHHIVSDGWSMAIFASEVRALYRAAAGEGPPLPELPVQYADYARWQRELFQGEILERQLAFWRDLLAGAPPVLELPIDRPRPAAQSDHGAAQPFELPPETAERLRALGRRHGATLFMTLLAGFGALLSRVTGQEDVSVGTPVAGRNRLAIEGLIGFFVNTLVLRCDLGDDPPFKELLARVRRVALAAHAHQDLPFEKLVEELQPERSLSHSPLFQVMFALEMAAAPEGTGAGMAIPAVSSGARTAKFDLTLAMGERDGRIVGQLEYRTDLFDAATIVRLLADLERLLAVAALNPDLRLSELPLLAPQEHRQTRGERAARPGPEPRSFDPGRAPSTPVEEAVAGVWCETLGLDRVGAGESFFDLGGHSLLAVKLASRLRAALGVDLPVRQIFETPTVATLARVVEQALRVGSAPEAPPLAPVSRDADLPLSFAQQRLWFLHQLDPESPAYNMPLAVRLTGGLDAPALARALSGIVRRHEVLRTRFESREGTPVQVVAPPSPLALPVIDLAGLPEGHRAPELLRLASREAARPFDLARAPLLRAHLVRLAPAEHALLATMHHIASDGWSMDVFTAETGALYRAFREGGAPPLPELTVQYADYAVWQRRWLQGEALAARIAWWREALAGIAPLELPTDRPRPPVQTFAGGDLAFALPGALSDALQALARRTGATLFMALLAAFQAFLGRITGQRDIAVGTPVAGRDRTELEGLIGFFVNTLVLRGDLAGNPGFRELLDRTRERALAAYTHQEVPFEKLVEELQPERHLSRTPLFQVMFQMASPPAEPDFPGLGVEPLAVGSGTAKFDLTLSLGASPAGLAGLANYNRDLFEAVTVQRFTRQLETLLGALVARPEEPLSGLPLLTGGERHQILVEHNDTAVAEPDEMRLHRLVERQAERSPGAVALAWEGGSLSYAGLDARSNRLARRLRRLGAGPDVPVAICAERSPDLVVGLLAILKAGGTYLPLDPSYPRERLELMVEDALSGVKAPVLLAQQGLAHLFAGSPAAARTHLVLLDGEEDAGAGESTGSLDGGAGPDHLAYVIYTSGSTGRPKGVMNTHRAICNRLLWMQEAFGLTSADRVLQKTPVSFDVSVWELFWPLLTGARLVLARPGGHRDGAYLVRLIEEQEITTLHFVPSMLQAFLEEPDVERCRSLRRVIASGEALPADLVRRFFARLPATELHNLYGPTEAAVDVTAHACTPGAHATVPIGRPIANVGIWLLDSAFEPVPAGVPGELYIGGVALARGYLGRPEMTAERFVPHPAGERPGARLYRTGDLARRLPDGRIEYLGRTDHQVKLRGFRIELGEIEAALAGCPGVREAVVVARRDPPGETRLVAYVVPAGEPGPAGTELRDRLRERLPDYMVPTAFVRLAALPSSPSGKVDRRALPAPERVPGSAGENKAPATPVEELVAGVWADLLGLDRVGTDESFFDLGGHSLLATRVLSRLRAALGVELPLRDLFEAPTVAALARAAERALRTGDAPEAPPLVPVPRGSDLPLSFAQQRLWFLDQLDPGTAAYNLPFAVRLTGEIDVAALAWSLAAVVHRHEILRTRFVAREGVPVQVIDPPPLPSLPEVDLAGLPGERRREELERLAAVQMARPLDLARGPLLRVWLARLDAGEAAVLAVFHHTVADGWSRAIFAAEMEALYRAARSRVPPVLAPLPVQYADYAVWQRRWLSGESLASQLAWWTQRLAGIPSLLALPTDRPRPAVQSFRGTTLPLALPAPLAEALASLGRHQGATLFMTLFAGFVLLLHRVSGAEDVVLGTPIANRTRAELEGLIGSFANTLVLRADLAGAPTFGELVARVREVALGAYAHQDLPFEVLVDAVKPERNLSYNPVFQVLFGLDNSPGSDRAGSGATPVSFAAAGTTSRFDLALDMTGGPGGLAGVLEYSTDLFDGATARRLAAWFETLLGAAAAAPETRIAVLPLLTAAELHQLLAEWNDAASRGPAAGCLHRLFEEQAARTPDAPALTCGSETLSYRELNRRANRMARRLREAGVGPEVPVGICVERSVEMVTGLLGILKAGGAYLPLDPAHPRERLLLLLEDARLTGAAASPVLLAPPEITDTLRYPGPTVLLVPEADETAEADDLDVEGGATGQSLAYVIYTSGSTGRPKGVEIRHASVAHLISTALPLFGFDSGDVWTVVHSFAFDFSVWEIWTPLASGGRLVIVPLAVSRSPEDLHALLAAERVTVFHQTPSALRLLLEAHGEPPGGAGTALRFVGCGGEALPRELAARLLGWGVPAWSLYGPTEATVWAAVQPLAGSPGHGDVPLGRPLPDARLHVLDAGLGIVPVGVPGELALGGPGLARGYRGRPDLTAKAFVPDTWSDEPGARLYRTGDLARRLPSGEVEFLGRIDHQVKVRGFRIEPGEVEAALREHPAVRQAAVVARPDAAGDLRLVAYVVTEDEGPSPAELRDLLGSRLPGHMVPSAFVRIGALPLNANGKLDRAALPSPEEAGGEAARRLGPRDLWELRMLEVWEEVFGTGPLGIQDNFFDLGGHSLLAVRLLARVRSRFGRQIPLAALFADPTVERLAALVRGGRPDLDRGPLVAIRPGGPGRPLFLVHPAGGDVFSYVELARRLDPDRPVFGLRATALDGGEAPAASLEELAARYLDAVRGAQPSGPYVLGGWSLGGVVAFEMARRLARDGEEALVVLIDSGLPSALQEAPGDAARELAWFARDFAAALGVDLAVSAGELSGHPPERQWELLIARAAHAGLPADRLDFDQLRRALDVSRAHLQAWRSYVPQPFDGPLVLFRAADNAESGEDGWSRLARGGLVVRRVPGDHYTMLSGSSVEILAALLEEEMARCAADRPLQTRSET
jgi:amino acid adenylation domain-containing protein/non-ribosomal peptide synthase protein (TIGR01720 family)